MCKKYVWKRFTVLCCSNYHFGGDNRVRLQIFWHKHPMSLWFNSTGENSTLGHVKALFMVPSLTGVTLYLFKIKQTKQKKTQNKHLYSKTYTFLRNSNTLQLTQFIIEGPDPGGLVSEHMAQLLLVSKTKIEDQNTLDRHSFEGQFMHMLNCVLTNFYRLDHSIKCHCALY